MKLQRLVLSLVLSTFAGFAYAGSLPVLPKHTEPANSAQVAAMLMAQEKATWEAVKRHDVAAFANLCLDNEYELFGDGTLLSIREALAQVPDTEILEYTIEDMQVIFATAGTALVRYRILAKTSTKGVVAPTAWMLATAVWVETPAGWKAAMYQETPLPPATPVSAPQNASIDLQ